MAKQLTRGESISEDKKAAIKADYEVGLATKSNIAKKHRINRTTLYKLAKKEKWVYAIGNRKATESITKKVTKRIVEDESKKLIDYTSKHLKQLDVIRQLTSFNLGNIAQKAKTAQKSKTQISKQDSEDFFALQKVCKISSETLAIIYRDEQTAMGINKDNDKLKLDINITSYAEADDSL